MLPRSLTQTNCYGAPGNCLHYSPSPFHGGGPHGNPQRMAPGSTMLDIQHLRTSSLIFEADVYSYSTDSLPGPWPRANRAVDYCLTHHRPAGPPLHAALCQRYLQQDFPIQLQLGCHLETFITAAPLPPQRVSGL